MNYDAIACGYDELHGSEQFRKLHIIAAEIAIAPSTRILDVGCGTGLSSLLGGSITGVDASAAMVKRCRIPAIIAPAEQLPFASRSFDLVISVTAIHNFTSHGAALREMKRVSKKHVSISVLRASPKAAAIAESIKSILHVEKAIEEQHDTLYFCTV